MESKGYLVGLSYVALSAFIWGCVQVLYFNEINYIPPLEIIAHRCIWAFFVILIFVLFSKNFKDYTSIFFNSSKFIYLTLAALLISSNWFFFVMSVTLNKVQDAAMGYFISPIFSVAFGYIFFKEQLNKLHLISILLIIFSIINLIFNISSFPWIALSVATTWSIYGLIKKKIKMYSQYNGGRVRKIIKYSFILYL